MKEPQHRILLPVLAAILGSGLLAVSLAEFDAFDFFYEVSRDYEHFELDEIILGVVFGMVAGLVTLTIILWRSLKATKEAYERLLKAHEHLRNGQNAPQIDTPPVEPSKILTKNQESVT